ncbi:MAG: TetR/AcrR family transcriptional regulator [Lautropia sp.]
MQPKQPFDREALQSWRRSAVLHEAASAFSRRGFHNTSMDDIAAALSIAKPTLYKYFQNKETLLYECHQLAMTYGEDALTAAETKGENGLAQLKIFTYQWMCALVGEFGACPVLTDVDSLAPAERKAVMRRRDKISQRLRALIDTGVKDESIGSCDPKLASLFVLGVLNWIPVWFRPDGAMSGLEIADVFNEMFDRTFSVR